MSDWRQQGLCAQVDADLWFPDIETGFTRRQTAQAKAMCARCSVIATCLAWALGQDIRDGVWGGLSEVERRKLRKLQGRPPRRREPAACGTETGYRRHLRAGEKACISCREAMAARSRQRYAEQHGQVAA